MITVTETPIRAVNVEEKIYTPPFLMSQLKFEGHILAIPNNTDKSHFLDYRKKLSYLGFFKIN